MNEAKEYPDKEGIKDESNLMSGLLDEMNRVREIIKEYERIPAGGLAVVMMRNDIALAEKAIASGDVAEILLIYEQLHSYEI